jgi:hypothetical protein
LSIFDPKKCYNPLSPRNSPDISPADYFLFPELKIKLKRLHFADVSEIQEASTDELKKVQTEELAAVFRNCTTAQKPVYVVYANGADFEFKKLFSHISAIFKTISPKMFGPHCVCCSLHHNP